MVESGHRQWRNHLRPDPHRPPVGPRARHRRAGLQASRRPGAPGRSGRPCGRRRSREGQVGVPASHGPSAARGPRPSKACRGCGQSGATSEYRVQEAEAALSEARIRLTAAQQALTNLGLPVQTASLDAVPDDQLADYLRFLGLPKPLADSLDPATANGNLLPVIGPARRDCGVPRRGCRRGRGHGQGAVHRGRCLADVADARHAAGGREAVINWASRSASGPTGARTRRPARSPGSAPRRTTRREPSRCGRHSNNDDGRLKANTFGAGG